MTILVVGSVAYDSIETPFGERDRILGGSATYFSYSASFFHPVSLIAVVGADFEKADESLLREKNIDISGLQKDPNGKTFHWKGKYGFDLNEAQTLETHLNVFESFEPTLSPEQVNCDFLFLANIDPELQRSVLEQVKGPKLVACDTMNFWIEGKRESLKKTLKHIDILIINDAEARMLGEESNLVKAARAIRAMGPKHLIVKRGEYGVILFQKIMYSLCPRFHWKMCLIQQVLEIRSPVVSWVAWPETAR